MKDQKLTIGLVRPGAMGGQIGVYDEHANLVRSLTTQHCSDKILALSSNGNIGTVTYEEQDGRRWVRTYNIESGNITGNWRLPDQVKEQVRSQRVYVARNTDQTGGGGGVVLALIAFAIVVNWVKIYYLPIIVLGALAALVYLAVNNHDHDNEQ